MVVLSANRIQLAANATGTLILKTRTLGLSGAIKKQEQQH